MKARIIFSLATIFVLVGCAPVSYTSPSSYTPSHVDYFQRGGKYIDEKNYNLAIQDYTEYIKRNSGNKENLGPAYGNRCLAFRLKGEYDLAIRDCSEAIRLNPKLNYTYRDRGYSFLIKEQYELAIRDFTEWIYLDPNEADAYRGRGLSYSKKGNYDSAIKDLTEAIRLNPSNAELYESSVMSSLQSRIKGDIFFS